MIPRARIDIRYSDLLAGAAALLPRKTRTNIAWPGDGEVIACLSVRSAFDLLLQCLALPAGSEVLLSAVTIRDMASIIRAHQLVPVPLDVDLATLAPTVESLRRLHSQRSGVLLLAHLFGAWSDFRPLIDAAHELGLLVVEDCAQSAGAGQFSGDIASDVRLFSFGPVKTDTALGGGLAVVNDAALADQMRALHATYPTQTTGAFARRLVRYTLLHSLEPPAVYGSFVSLCRIAGRSHDDIISASTRGFRGSDLLTLIRRRPSAAQLALLARRINHPRPDAVRGRADAARYLASQLDRTVRIPGAATRNHTYWLFPVIVPNPDELMRSLWADGLDATRGASSLAVIDAPADRPEADPAEARSWMSDLLFIPCYASVPRERLQRLAQRVNEHVEHD